MKFEIQAVKDLYDDKLKQLGDQLCYYQYSEAKSTSQMLVGSKPDHVSECRLEIRTHTGRCFKMWVSVSSDRVGGSLSLKVDGRETIKIEHSRSLGMLKEILLNFETL